MRRIFLAMIAVVSLGVIPLVPSAASAGELYSLSFGGSKYEVGRRSAYSSSGGWFSRANYGTSTVHRARLSTAAARQTNPKLYTRRSSSKSYGYQRSEIQRLIKEKKREQQEYKKLVKAYERELKKKEKEAVKRQREIAKQARLAKQQKDRETRLAKKSKKSIFGSNKESDGNATEKKSGLSFWQRLKRAIFGS